MGYQGEIDVVFYYFYPKSYVRDMIRWALGEDASKTSATFE